MTPHRRTLRALRFFFVRLCRSRRLARTSNTSRRFSSRNFARRWRRRWKSPGENLRARRRAPSSNRPRRSDANPRLLVEETGDTSETSAITITFASRSLAPASPRTPSRRTISSSSKGETPSAPMGLLKPRSTFPRDTRSGGWRAWRRAAREAVATSSRRRGARRRDFAFACASSSAPDPSSSGSRGTAAVR